MMLLQMTRPFDSRLRYRESGEEVQLGDRVTLKRFMRRPISGVVCYLPDVSPRHSEMEFEGQRHWAIELADGSVLSWLYLPTELQPSKRIAFVGRAIESKIRGLQPEDELK